MSRRIFHRAPDPHQAPPVSAATRRELFGTMGAMLLLTAVEAGTAKAAELDGELLACCAEALAIDRESDRLWATCLALPDAAADDHPAWAAYDAHTETTRGPWHALARRIGELPARTPEGLRAKVAAARSAIPGGRREDPEPCDRLAWSVFEDVLGRAWA